MGAGYVLELPIISTKSVHGPLGISGGPPFLPLSLSCICLKKAKCILKTADVACAESYRVIELSGTLIESPPVVQARNLDLIVTGLVGLSTLIAAVFLAVYQRNASQSGIPAF